MNPRGPPHLDAGHPLRGRTPSGERSLRIPYWVYDAGCFQGRAMGSAFQVFACLHRYADWRTGNGRLGRAKIADITGLHDRETLARAFAALQQLGLIKVWWRTTDRGYIRYYQLAQTEEDMRQNAVTYLVLNARKAQHRYVSGITRGMGAGISRQQCSSISYTSNREPTSSEFSTAPQPEPPRASTLSGPLQRLLYQWPGARGQR